MKKAFVILCAALFATSSVALTSCGSTADDSTAGIVAKASKMTLEELEAASKTEMEASDSTFKVVGLTSTLAKALQKFCDTYDWMEYDVNTYVNNSYKDYALLTALEQADTSYFADFALVQDARSLSDYLEAGITVNYIPSDYKELNLPEENTYPLKGLYFNKIFFSNERLGVDLHNVWQLAGSPDDVGHLDNLSFQSPITEQINMSFILSLYDDANQARLEAAYQSFYGTAWVASEDYKSCGEEFVHEFVANISRWHSSDGTAMKKTQYEETAKEGVDPFIYYGAFAKMKDAAGAAYGEETAMDSVGWDKEIEGFNGFMYAMYSQIVKNAEHPYTACLYARFLLTPDCYTAMCYNSSTPNKAGDSANMYGYYYPCTSTTVGVNDNDWTKAKWIEKSINEDFAYLSTVKGARINEILALVSSNTKAS
jgi:ABC-type Fe3+ transport system substrate-binding protein